MGHKTYKGFAEFWKDNRPDKDVPLDQGTDYDLLKKVAADAWHAGVHAGRPVPVKEEIIHNKCGRRVEECECPDARVKYDKKTGLFVDRGGAKEGR